jgi:hypothetical protein
MTKPLITTNQVKSLRKIAERAFNTDVQIWKRRIADNAYEDDATETFVWQETVKGWVYSSPTPSATVQGGVIATLNLYRLFVAVGTDVDPGDRVKMSGNFFQVIDTIEESTWLPLLRCSLRRIE